MVEFDSQPSRVALRMTPTKSPSRLVLRNKTKDAGASKADVNSSRLRVMNLLKTPSPNPRSGTKNRTGKSNPPKVETPTLNNEVKVPNKGEALESRIRSALSRSSCRESGSPPSTVKSSKSVKWDPATVFCGEPAVTEPISTQAGELQDCIDAILKCKKDDRGKLQLFINALEHTDNDERKHTTEVESQSTLNPPTRELAIREFSSLGAGFNQKQSGTQRVQASQTAPKRQSHARPALAQDMFEPQTPTRINKPQPLSPSPFTLQFQNSFEPMSPGWIGTAVPNYRPLANQQAQHSVETSCPTCINTVTPNSWPLINHYVQDNLEPQPPAWIDSSSPTPQRQVNQQIQNSSRPRPPGWFKTAGPIHRSTVNHKAQNTHQNSLRVTRLYPVYANCQDTFPTDPFDDHGPGREALAIDSDRAEAILKEFVLKYPMTGEINQSLQDTSDAAAVQQLLEFKLMQEKEKRALERRFKSEDGILGRGSEKETVEKRWESEG
jgi:hypothetical protein